MSYTQAMRRSRAAAKASGIPKSLIETSGAADLRAFVNGQGFMCRIKTDGRVVVDQHASYVKQTLAGRTVSMIVNAPERCFDVFEATRCINQLPLKGLVGTMMPFVAYVELMGEQARYEELEQQPRVS